MKVLQLIGILFTAIHLLNVEAGRCKRFAECYCPSIKEMRCAGNLPLNIDMLRKAASIFYLEVFDARGRIFSIYFLGEVIESCPSIKEIHAEGCACETVTPYLNIPGVRVYHTCDEFLNSTDTTTEVTTTDSWFPFIPWWPTTPPRDGMKTTTKDWESKTTDEPSTTTDEPPTTEFSTTEISTEDLTTDISTIETQSESSYTSPMTPRRLPISTRASPGRKITPSARHANPDGKGGDYVNDDYDRFPLSYTDFLIIGGIAGSSFVSMALFLVYWKWRKGYFNPPNSSEENAEQRRGTCWCLRRCLRCLLPRRELTDGEDYERISLQEREGNQQDANEGQDENGGGEGAVGVSRGSFESVDIEDVGFGREEVDLETDRAYFRRRSPRKKDVPVKKDTTRNEEETNISDTLDARKLAIIAEISFHETRNENYEHLQETDMSVQTGVKFDEDDSSASSVEIFSIQKLLASKKQENKEKNQNFQVAVNTPESDLSDTPERSIPQVQSVPLLKREKTSAENQSGNSEIAQEESSLHTLPSDTPPISIFFPEEGDVYPYKSTIPSPLDLSLTDTSHGSESIFTLYPSDITASSIAGSTVSSITASAFKTGIFRSSSAPASISTSQDETDEEICYQPRKLTQSVS